MTGKFGAQITLLIHQEKLDAPRGGAHSTTHGKLVWTTLADVARQLMLVWAERFRKLCPAGVEAAALVTAVPR